MDGKTPHHGLGLSIYQLIIQEANGRIRVESRQTEGSTFFFTLPLKRRKTGQEYGPLSQ